MHAWEVIKPYFVPDIDIPPDIGPDIIGITCKRLSHAGWQMDQARKIFSADGVSNFVIGVLIQEFAKFVELQFQQSYLPGLCAGEPKLWITGSMNITAPESPHSRPHHPHRATVRRRRRGPLPDGELAGYRQECAEAGVRAGGLSGFCASCKYVLHGIHNVPWRG